MILATGELASLTGSSGDGYEMAAAVGHAIVPPRPSLVPLAAEGEDCRRIQGLSLRNVAVKVKNQKKKWSIPGRGSCCSPISDSPAR